MFNCIVYTGDISKGDKGFICYHSVNNLRRFIGMCDKKFEKWVFFNIFDKETKKFVECYVRKVYVQTEIKTD